MLLHGLFATSAALVVYHHAIYPLVLKYCVPQDTSPPSPAMADAHRSDIALIVPAYNEERYIAAKIRNCAGFDYPAGALRIVIACDGSSDRTADFAREAIDSLDGPLQGRFELRVFGENRGKIAVLNEFIAECREPIVALSDVTAILRPDALRKAAAHFSCETTGFVTGKYDVTAASAGQRQYWRYQNAIKSGEAALGSPVGAHGAFYLFRRSAWERLAPNVINDDVILPMQIVQKGFRGIYDCAIRISEIERDNSRTDMARRRRLAAGAVQQMWMLRGLVNPARPGLAFAFVSGKGLRAVMPFILATALLSNAVLAAFGSSIWMLLLTLHVAAYEIAIAGMSSAWVARLPGVPALSYFVAGHWNGLIGALQYLGGRYRKPWSRPQSPSITGEEFLSRTSRAGKRTLDIALALVALVFFALLFIPIALAIKLESRGPVFYRQLRVGLRTPAFSRLFHLTKFRTMRVDAEAATGAVWASEHDPRVTRVGRFLRKSRLDELPQCLDVLRGDMSIVGPRPERPQFFTRLEAEIPYYAERTYGLKPGITGLAQVTLPYDSSIEDVRAKVLHDHAYALQLSVPGRWLVTDLSIIARTFTVMVLGKGR